MFEPNRIKSNQIRIVSTETCVSIEELSFFERQELYGSNGMYCAFQVDDYFLSQLLLFKLYVPVLKIVHYY